VPKDLDAETLTNLAFDLYPSLFTSGATSVDGESLLTRIHAVRRGLLPEKEFFSILAWLGNCVAINRIDQMPMPVEISDNFRAPDFLAVAKYSNRIVPVLIECKATNDSKIVWSQKYFESLKNFASLLNLPLLLAWKWNDLWIVADCVHFQKKVTAYHLDYETAVKENLLSFLFGNRWIIVNKDASFRLDTKVIDSELDTQEPLIAEGTYTLQVEKAGFYVGENEVDVSAAGAEILFSAFAENMVKKLDGNRARIVFYPHEGTTTVQLYDLLLIDLYIRSRAVNEIIWEEALLQPFHSTAEVFRTALAEAGTTRYIDLVMSQTPTTIPSFLRSDLQ
jgi:Holliday junction resolvase